VEASSTFPGSTEFLRRSVLMPMGNGLSLPAPLISSGGTTGVRVSIGIIRWGALQARAPGAKVLWPVGPASLTPQSARHGMNHSHVIALSLATNITNNLSPSSFYKKLGVSINGWTPLRRGVDLRSWTCNATENSPHPVGLSPNIHGSPSRPRIC
jgi:hypothetical protein